MKFLKRKKITISVIISIITIISFALIFLEIMQIQEKKYVEIINSKVEEIIDNVIATYPDIREEDILKIINSSNKHNTQILKKYGYENELSNIKRLQNELNHSKIQNIALIILFGITTLAVYITYIIRQEKKIKDINDYIKQINNKNYTLKIRDNQEDELSKLRNELYKTTIILKENAENSEKEKEKLSNAMADISHQLKTPLTSIRIMLDNINDNPDMDSRTRDEFILEISKQVEWISSLVISLLKIAKFDAGTIKMENTEINIKELIDDILNNLAIIIELKEITIITEIDKNATFVADYKWQKEAITNIIKNAIEHSNNGSKIYVKVEDTRVFLKIIVKDEGKGIDKSDLKHIFERFYRAKNSNENSIGIGLPLAKTIIEQNNGYIKVDSEIGKGTSFIVKYIR